MRKRLVLLVLIGLALAAIGWAQETTWINPFTLSAPSSMLSQASSGLFYDELDILFRSPAELSNYKGINLYTSYGNFEHNWILNQGISPFTGTGVVNPFSTTAPTQQGGGANIGTYLFGFTMPVASYRMGAAGGFVLGQTDLLNIGGLTDFWTRSNTGTVDANANNQPDYTFTNTESYTDLTTNATVNVTGGFDLNPLGVSLWAYLNGQSRNIGGSYAYARTQGTDAGTPLPADTVSTKNVFFGTADGKPAAYPVPAGTTWTVQANGEMPLSVGGVSMPVTATVLVGGQPYSTVAFAYSPLASFNFTTVNAAGVAAKTSSLTFNEGLGTTNPDTSAGVIPNQTTLTQANLRAAVTADLGTLTGGALALDTKNYANSTFMVGLGGNIDPVLKVSDQLKFRTRGAVSYTIGFQNYKVPGTGSIVYSEANAASATNSAYNLTITDTGSPVTGTLNLIGGQLGGILEFDDPSGVLMLGAGMFYAPSFSLDPITIANRVVTTTTSWTDQTNTDPQAAGLTGIGPGVAQGTRVDTTTTINGTGSTNTITNAMYLPVGAKLGVIKDKLTLAGGYTLTFNVTTTSTTTPAAVGPTTVTTVANTS
ncbi:MAG TPA: hypothetical protein VFH83_02700, partial [Spirochaetia bacterium]|nr:hypothetical protein [Spirochaetia bacterium]